MALFDDDKIISWDFANWVTVTLMALISFFLLGLLQKYMQGKGKGNPNAGS